MHLRLVYLIIVSSFAGSAFLAFLIVCWSEKQRPRGSAHTTPRYNLLPIPIRQAGDASDAVTARTGGPFSLDGRGESLVLPPLAANKNESNVGHHDQQSLTSPIHMDGAER